MNWATDMTRGDRGRATEHPLDDSIYYRCPEDGGTIERRTDEGVWWCILCGWFSENLQDAHRVR